MVHRSYHEGHLLEALTSLKCVSLIIHHKSVFNSFFISLVSICNYIKYLTMCFSFAFTFIKERSPDLGTCMSFISESPVLELMWRQQTHQWMWNEKLNRGTSTWVSNWMSQQMIPEHLYIKFFCEGSVFMWHEDRMGHHASTQERNSEICVCVYKHRLCLITQESSIGGLFSARSEQNWLNFLLFWVNRINNSII